MSASRLKIVRRSKPAGILLQVAILIRLLVCQGIGARLDFQGDDRLLLPLPMHTAHELAGLGKGAGIHGDPAPTGGMIPWGAPHLKAAVPGFEDGVRIGVGGDIEFARARSSTGFMR